jgi:cytochrome c556
MFIRTACLAIVLAVSATVVIAQSNPIAQRKELMKGMGEQARLGNQMMRGQAPFDLAKAQAIFATFTSVPGKMVTLFPEDSKTGGDTEASPKIWEDMEGFKKRFASFETEAKAAQATLKDEDTFRVAFGNVSRNCGACHENFRIKKQ